MISSVASTTLSNRDLYTRSLSVVEVTINEEFCTKATDFAEQKQHFSSVKWT